jgi:serine/threonine protein kinase
LDVKPENIFISLDHVTPSPSSREAAKSSKDESAAKVSAAPATPAAVEASQLRPSVVAHRGGECSGNESTDSGHASGCDARFDGVLSGEMDERISYKIGDLGHVAPIYGDHIPEEGDCRYMAPELLADDVNRENLPKADIFSLGLTLYEAASLQELPKNSLEDPMYERLKGGHLPFVEGYSKEFNLLLKVSLVQLFCTFSDKFINPFHK